MGGYYRVSRDLREGRSIREQKAECRQWVERENGWKLVVERADPNVSATRWAKKDRLDWFALLEDIRANRLDAVVFWEISRGTRRRAEWAEFADLAEDKHLLILVNGRVYDATDPQDMGFLDWLVSRGVEEAGQTRKRVVRSVDAQAEMGGPSGEPAFGTKSVYDPRTGALQGRVLDRTPWPPQNPETTPVEMVRDAARKVRQGVSPQTIVAEWNRKGWHSKWGGTWTYKQLTQLLQSPALMGRRIWRGKLQPANWDKTWEKVLTPKQWYEVQEKLVPDPGRSERSRNSGAVHPYSGVARCGVCGAPVGSSQTGREKRKVYRCRGWGPGMRSGCTSRQMNLLEAHIEALVVAEFSRPDVLDRFRPVGNENREEDEERLAVLREELAQLEEAAKTPGPRRMPMSSYLPLRASLMDEIEGLEVRLKPVPMEPMAQELASQNAGTVLRRWRSWTPEQQRAAMRAFTESVRILPVGRIGRRTLTPQESVEIVWVSAAPV